MPARKQSDETADDCDDTADDCDDTGEDIGDGGVDGDDDDTGVFTAEVLPDGVKPRLTGVFMSSWNGADADFETDVPRP